MATIPVGSWEFVSHGAGTTMVGYNNKLQPDLYVYVGDDGSGNLTVTPSLYVWARKTSSSPYVPYYYKPINDSVSYCQIDSQTKSVSGSFPATVAAWKDRTMSYGGTNFEIRCDSDENSDFVANCSKKFDASAKTRDVDLRIYVRYKDTTTSYMPKAAYDVSGTITLPATLSAPSSVSITSVSTSTTTATVSASVSGSYTKIQYSKDNGGSWQDSNYFSGLTPDTTYNFKARAMNVDSDWVVSSAYSKATTVPSAPTLNVYVGNIGTETATIYGSITTNPDSFWRLHLYDTNGTWKTSTTGSQVSYTQTGLAHNTGYALKYQVTSVNDTRYQGVKSISFTTSGNAPTLNSVSVSAARTTAALTPSVTYDTNASYKSYSIKYGTSTSYGSTSSSTTLSNLTPNTTYYYSMMVTDNWSRTSSAKTGSFTTTGNSPSITTHGVGTYGQTNVTMKYVAAYDTNDSYSSRMWQYGTTTSYGKSVTGTDVITGLTANTKYYYKLTVTSSKGRSSTTTGSFTTDPDTQTITEIKSVDIAGTGAVFDFTIENPSGATKATLKCEIYDKGAGTLVKSYTTIGVSPTIRCSVIGLTSGKTYELQAKVLTEGQTGLSGTQTTYSSDVVKNEFRTVSDTIFAIVKPGEEVKRYKGYILGAIDIYNGYSATWINGKYSTIVGEALTFIEEVGSAAMASFMTIGTTESQYAIKIPVSPDGQTIVCTIIGTDDSNIVRQSYVYSTENGEVNSTLPIEGTVTRLYAVIKKDGLNRGMARYVDVQLTGSTKQIALTSENIVRINGKIRYIDIYQAGSNVDDNSQVVELDVYNDNGENVALGKTVTKIAGGDIISPLSIITDGEYDDPTKYAEVEPTSETDKLTILRVDLGEEYSDIRYVRLWRIYSDNRIYNDTRILARDGEGAISWKFQSYKMTGAYAESENGYLSFVQKYDADYKPEITGVALNPDSASASITAANGVNMTVSATSKKEEQEETNEIEALMDTMLVV